ncbi:MAG: cupin domain-containing protein [Proteobacteria bacterium]|jgi:mannose-6-phosphate isomerase-like protein (cupin superfamily)|nr:cupin domain-containing protein [Pseudomonadota bacterium]
MTAADGVLDLTKTYLHLSDGPDVVELPVTDDFWETIATRDDLGDGRLISAYRFTESWDSWEVHPAGEEIVCLLNGAADMHLEEPGGERVVELRGRGSLIVPRGIWHTTTIHEPSDMIFITRGAGTVHRPR